LTNTAIKKNYALNLILPATTDPIIIAGVYKTNIIWKAIKTKVGSSTSYHKRIFCNA
jgi:hypothetical protein